MADTEAFEFVCGELEARTSLDRLASRGTVRIALKQAGLDSRSATPEQMAVVVERLLTAELTNRGVLDSVSLCALIAEKTRRLEAGTRAETPDAVFRRLGG